MVDRPDVEAPQGVELTGTNSRTATHTPPHKGRQDKRNNHFTRMTGRHPAHHTTDPSAHTRPPSGPQPTTQPPGTPDKDPRDDNYRFAAAMAQGRRPDPFRTRKRRPGTAMVLHPTGCGRVARRRTNTPRRGRDATRRPSPSSIFFAFSFKHTQNTRAPPAATRTTSTPAAHALTPTNRRLRGVADGTRNVDTPAKPSRPRTHHRQLAPSPQFTDGHRLTARQLETGTHERIRGTVGAVCDKTSTVYACNKRLVRIHGELKQPRIG